ncbi:MAG TPA: response regulator, partial [Spirochaetia bacterium]|nr:response regulator [Spirochaetia bacterium]
MYMNILIVDDEPGLRSGLSKVLALQGYRALEASTSAEARRIMASAEVHLVLLDLKLGAEDGLVLLKSLKTEEPTVPIIIITGHGDVTSAVQCMQAGATNYISKPIDNDLLLSILDKERSALSDRQSTFAFRESLRTSARTRLAPSSSPQMKDIEKVALKIRDSVVPLLILGETGTG